MTAPELKGSRGAGRVAFLARRDVIQERIDAGYPIKAIFNEYEKELGIGYPQFTRYVSKYIRTPEENDHSRREESKPVQQAPAEVKPATPSPKPGGSSTGKPATPKAGKPAFQHDASSGNRDDLI